MEYKKLTLSEKLNIIRAGVLGANDGIIGGAGVILGVTGATTNNTVVFVAGIAEMLAVAFSMASGEFVSVSSQKDTEKAVVAKAETLLATQPTIVHDEIAIYYEQRGADPKLATRVADDLMTNDALKHYVQIKYGIVVGKYLSPAHALVSSFIASISGGIWPLLSVILLPDNLKVIGTILATLWALFLTGWLSAWAGRAQIIPAILRNIFTGVLTMAFTYWLGTLFK